MSIFKFSYSVLDNLRFLRNSWKNHLSWKSLFMLMIWPIIHTSCSIGLNKESALTPNYPLLHAVIKNAVKNVVLYTSVSQLADVIPFINLTFDCLFSFFYFSVITYRDKFTADFNRLTKKVKIGGFRNSV